MNTSELLQLYAGENEIFRKKLSNAYFRGEDLVDRFKWLYNGVNLVIMSLNGAKLKLTS